MLVPGWCNQYHPAITTGIAAGPCDFSVETITEHRYRCSHTPCIECRRPKWRYDPILWPATTKDRFTTRDFICGPTVSIGAVALLAFRDTLIDRDPASTGMCTLKRYRKKSSAASIFFSERSRTTVSA